VVDRLLVVIVDALARGRVYLVAGTLLPQHPEELVSILPKAQRGEPSELHARLRFRVGSRLDPAHELAVRGCELHHLVDARPHASTLGASVAALRVCTVPGMGSPPPLPKPYVLSAKNEAGKSGSS
jgi:hypothetical protein